MIMRNFLPRILLCTLTLALLPYAPPGLEHPASSTEPSADDFQRGMSYAAWWIGLYQTPEADRSLHNLVAIGATWLSLIVTCYQETIDDTEITCALPRTPSDDDLIHVIELARELGLAVMLKPHVDLNNDPDHWRGQIGENFDEDDWAAWFASYRQAIYRYADLAQAQSVEQFSVGCELSATVGRVAQWRETIAGVRDRFSGPLTYAANHSGEESSITWWDAVDFIGVDAYYPLTDHNDPTLAELEAAWEPISATLSSLAATWNRPVLFTEVGYRSVDGANVAPWDWQSSAPIDLQEQADCYQALINSVGDAAWLAGIFWWMWWADDTIGGPEDDSYTPYGKPAEDVLCAFYTCYRGYLPLVMRSSSSDQRVTPCRRRSAAVTPCPGISRPLCVPS